MIRRGCDERGMALALALVAILIISILLAGIMLLSVTHYSLSNTNNDYANALNLAEAGINWELNKISRDAALADNTPFSVEFPAGSGRFFEVYVRDYETGGIWVPPADLWVISTGTVDGVSRTVRVRARGHSLFGPEGPYALFGIKELRVGGNLTAIGAAGTNGLVNVTGTSVVLDGNFFYCGETAGGDDVSVVTTGDIMHATLSENFPTVNELANLRALSEYGIATLEGIDFFSNPAYNNNPGMKYIDADGQTRTISDDPSLPTPTMLDKDLFLSLNTDTIILDPGDYCFQRLELPANRNIIVNSDLGEVNVWLGAEAAEGKDDSINGTMEFAGHDITKFHLYEGSKRTLKLSGTMDFWGSVYAYNGPDDTGSYYGTIVLLGDGNIWGPVIGYEVAKASGNAIIDFPSSGGSGPPNTGDPIYFYGFAQEWEELNPL